MDNRAANEYEKKDATTEPVTNGAVAEGGPIQNHRYVTTKRATTPKKESAKRNREQQQQQNCINKRVPRKPSDKKHDLQYVA